MIKPVTVFWGVVIVCSAYFLRDFLLALLCVAALAWTWR